MDGKPVELDDKDVWSNSVIPYHLQVQLCKMGLKNARDSVVMRTEQGDFQKAKEWLLLHSKRTDGWLKILGLLPE